MIHRPFESYAEYVYLQGGKARHDQAFLMAHLEKNTGAFVRIFRTAKPHLMPGPILCLGARTGAESLAAEQVGFIGSLGVDLHPVGPTVMQGDWHQLPLKSHGFANVYSNSLDHCISLEKLTAEVQRMLLPGGRFYVMATNRGNKSAEAWLAAKGHEAMYWDTSDELRDEICARGFVLKAEWHKGKWGHYVFGVAK